LCGAPGHEYDGTMNPTHIKTWIEIIQGLITACASVIGAFWVWIRFVLERGLLPPSQFELGLRTVGLVDAARIVEVTIRISNKGSSALVITDLRVRLRYLNADDKIEIIDDAKLAAFGRLKFPHAHVLNNVGAEKRPAERTDEAGKQYELGSGEFRVIRYNTFVQPGVEQPYTFVTALPRQAAYVLVHGSFLYEMRPSRMQKHLLFVARRLGMLQYSLGNINQPHTVEKSFKLGEET